MSNSYFEFKQFSVDQRNSAMKVNTDSVLLGAWADIGGSLKILDVGTGTGLLALMVAQRSEASIVGIDIDAGACGDARENFSRSPWAERLSVINEDFATYSQGNPIEFDAIISNPPYFNDSLKSSDALKTQARHTDTLPHSTLLRGARELLSDNGKFFVVLPFDNHRTFVSQALLHGLHYTSGLHCKPLPDKKANRILMRFDRTWDPARESELTIRAGGNVYTREYLSLTRDFYRFA